MAIPNNLDDELDSLSVAKSYKCAPEMCLRCITHPNRGLKILHINIRSIQKNFDEISVLMKLLGFHCDVIVLSECWLSKISQLPTLDGYTSYHTNNTFNQNDGCAIYIKSSIKHDVKEPNFADANCLICTIESISIIAIYRSPSYRNITNFIDSLDKILTLPTQSVVLIGDINIDIKNGNNDTNSDEYLTCAAAHGLLPAHLYPTRVSNCLDHILLKTNFCATAIVIESSITDHEPLLLFLQAKNKDRNRSFTKYKLNRDAVIETINGFDWSPILKMTDADSASEELVGNLSTIIKANTYEYKIPRKQRTLKPWITPGLLRCIRNRDRMHAKLKKCINNEILRITYNRYRNHCNSLLKKLKRAYEKEEFSKAKNNIKATWDVIKKVADISSNVTPPIELLHLSDSPRLSLNIVNDYFAGIGKNLASKIKPISPTPIAVSSKSGSSMVLLETTEMDVEGIILTLKLDSATGWDGIPLNVIRATRTVLVPIITHVCNLAISSGVFPAVFKRAVVHPIHKSGRRDDVNNYRPISVLSAMSKILERVLNKSLLSFLNVNNILSPNQFGFRRGMSTEDAVLALTEHAVRTLDNKHKCLGIFIDLSKAFDTVSAPELLKKMESIGIRGVVLEMFRDYLRGRTQVVKVEQNESDERPITYGVPQGSILGPTLFLIYINDLCQIQINSCKIVSYADDTSLLVDGKDWAQCYHNAEKALTCVVEWLRNNLLTVNVSKTFYIPFAIKSNLSPPASYTLKAHSCKSANFCDCPPIAKSPTVKYLGVHIDQYLNWHKHLDALVSRTRKLIYVFKKLRNSADPDTLKVVYFALCQSILAYCIPAWGGATENVFLRLERAQRAVLKILFYRPRRYSTVQLYAESKVLTVRQLYVFQSMLRKHSVRPLSEPTGRVKHTVFPQQSCKTSFAKRCYYINSSKIYNQLNKELKFFHSTKYQFKSALREYLLKLDYRKTENLFIGSYFNRKD